MTTLKQIFDTAISLWIKNDPRWEKEVQRYLSQNVKTFEKLSVDEKQYFNQDFLTNPYHDSLVYYGNQTVEVKRLIVGIDVQWAELLLVNELNKTSDKKIDLVVGHHPESSGLSGIAPLQKWVAPAIAQRAWVPINVSEKIEFPRVIDVEQRFSPMNHHRVNSFAELLDIPYVGIHTPADNCCQMYYEQMIENNKESLYSLQDIIDLLMKEPEQQIAKKRGAGPAIWNGETSSRTGLIKVTGITGGTESSKEIYAEYAKAWVWTILEMHMSKEHLEEAKKHNLNVIMTDHMASDSLWMNLIFDEIEKLWVEIMAFSGFTRFKRS